ncbi:hypothetical protein [uncultured Finegoldia sp.]|uniref:hypothetical protein n=1 Tax=uncultured Finegoldia sp. TaxID=328009 RepID=UPI0026073879|nr:hypothetical protein [uncultured Finegoldia sp.]
MNEVVLIAGGTVSTTAIAKHFREFGLKKVYMPLMFIIIIHLAYTLLYKNKSKQQR